MAVGFSHFGIVILKTSLLRCLRELDFTKVDQVSYVNYLLNSNFSDEFIVAVESMDSDLSDDIEKLKAIGLTWNDGKNSIDFYTINEGQYTASWLKYLRARDTKLAKSGHYNIFKYVDDYSDICKCFEHEFMLTESFSSWKILNNRYWPEVAFECSNQLHQATLIEFKHHVFKENRVCPKPIFWNDINEIAISNCINGSEHPPIPLILGGWFYSSDEEKAHRLWTLISWSYQNKTSTLIWAYLIRLKNQDWHYKVVNYE